MTFPKSYTREMKHYFKYFGFWTLVALFSRVIIAGLRWGVWYGADMITLTYIVLKSAKII